MSGFGLPLQDGDVWLNRRGQLIPIVFKDWDYYIDGEPYHYWSFSTHGGSYSYHGPTGRWNLQTTENELDLVKLVSRGESPCPSHAATSPS